MVGVEDVSGTELNAQIFVAYVKASLLLGEISTVCQQKSVSESEFERLRNSLLWWTKELSCGAQSISLNTMRAPTSSNFLARQLLLLHFASINLLYRKWRISGGVCGVALAASSVIACLLETFLARDECRHLACTLCFYAVVAAVPLVEALNMASMHDEIAVDLANIHLFLETMGKKWPSALSALQIIQKFQPITMRNSTERSERAARAPELKMQDLMLFEGYEVDSCRLWQSLTSPTPPQRPHNAQDTMGASQGNLIQEQLPTINNSINVYDNFEQRDTEPAADVWMGDLSAGVEYDDFLGGWLTDENFFGAVIE